MKGGYDILPNIMLVGAEQELSQTGKEHRLKEAIAPVAEKYDYIIMSTPPSLGVLTVNVFTVEFPIVKDTTPNMMNPRLYTTSYNKPQGQQFDDTAVLSFIKLQYT